MRGTSKRLLAAIAGMLLLVLAGTAGIWISDKNQESISGGLGTYRSQEEGKILEIDREKGEITIQRTKDEKEILLDCSKESVMEDIALNPYKPGDQIKYYFWLSETSGDRIKVEELFKLRLCPLIPVIAWNYIGAGAFRLQGRVVCHERILFLFQPISDPRFYEKDSSISVRKHGLHGCVRGIKDFLFLYNM